MDITTTGSSGGPTWGRDPGGRKRLGEVLETAMAFEHTAQTLYRSLSARIGATLRDLVAELADEEARHYRLFEELAERPELQAQVADLVPAPASDPRFTRYARSAELGETLDDRTILRQVLEREQAALEQYSALAAAAPDGLVRDLFTYLALEDLAHKAELEYRYCDLMQAVED